MALKCVALPPLPGQNAYQGGLQIGKAHRFDKVLLKTGAETRLDVLLGAKAAQRNAMQPVTMLHLRHDLPPAAIGQPEIADEQVKFLLCG